MAEEACLKWCVARAVYFYDLSDMNPDFNMRNRPLTASTIELVDRHNAIHRSGASDTEVDYNCSLQLYLTDPEHILVITHQKAYHSLLIGYRNVTQVKNHLNPYASMEPLAYNVVNNLELRRFCQHNRVDSYLPKFETRCVDAAYDGCFRKFLEDKIEENSNFNPTSAEIYEFKNWLNTEEGKTAFSAAIDFCKYNLKENITVDDL